MTSEQMDKYKKFAYYSPNPANFEDIIELNGYKVCQGCGAVIEKVSGCVHMICVCKYEFCYTCNAKWWTDKRNCSCDLFPGME